MNKDLQKPAKATALACLLVCASAITEAGNPIVDTMQDKCFDATGLTIVCPGKDKPFFGQDAQHQGATARYTDNSDGTITDEVTGLTWTQNDSGKAMDWKFAIA